MNFWKQIYHFLAPSIWPQVFEAYVKNDKVDQFINTSVTLVLKYKFYITQVSG